MSNINFPKDCTMKLDFYNGEELCSRIFVDFLNEKIYLENFTDDILHRAFGVVENPTMKDFEEFLEDRSFPQGRGDIKDILDAYGLDFYDPLSICEKTKGRTHEDNQWMDFEYRRLEAWPFGTNKA